MLSRSTKLCDQCNLAVYERLLAFHDDVYAVAQPERIVAVQFWVRSCDSTAAFKINAGKTQIWNRGGHVPAGTKPSSTKFEPSILTQRSGSAVLIVPRKNVASEFWALLLAQQSLSGRSWVRCHRGCLVASANPRSATCNQRGFSCCSALHHGRHFIHGYVILTHRSIRTTA